ncbi:MAG: ParB/RepB/Spo0J family partition protein [Candidatus Cryptobacteroides sp.]|nr:ParB/RepB/Spo0J family partition protein [Bacteroidales bacterium]MDD7532414.1 ParB/RepB/Spo0J family partition protein [Bacteroidales bacterium]MDY2706921.1 ParB/RepB/Spo0J family partition protein [Candidatus Cryptobacteroides sp.]MDY2857790.1 ParB/RepB/Spo0J family partition protein [Candidatus Cryptobacteroides sp.]MDY5743692.1 ParB/RepB/Spo0J family partition protein [Candidatus Cryptobacteroides sp.]
MAKQTHGLGKGLEALLGGGATDPSQFRKPVGYINKDVVTRGKPLSSNGDIVRIPVDMVEPNPYQPRMSFDNEALNELADSIRTLGLIQPITVRRKSDDRFQIISGERRFRACRLCNMDMIPAYVMEADDQGMLEMAIVENIQRENLDPIEVAMSYQRLIDECRLTQEQMAERVGKKRASVTNTLRLLRLPAKVQHDLKVGLISVGHAKVILGVDDPSLQEKLCDLVVRDGLSVRQLEEKLRKLMNAGEKDESQVRELPEHCYRVLEIMGKYFDNNISLKRNDAGKGSMTIRFGNDAEMQRFLQALENAKL